MTSPLNRFTEFVKSIPSEDTINYLNTVLGKKGVKVIYEKAENFQKDAPTYDRLMFSTFDRSCPFDFPGTILSSTNGGPPYKVISVPPAPPVTRYKSNYLFKNFSRCSIVKANDGTTVTLYYHNDKWVISTHRGFEVNSYNWFGTRTYQDVVNEVLAQYSFDYNKLDKNKCYTFGFNHNEFHPFLEGRVTETESKEDVKNVSRAWFIQSVDLTKFNNGQRSYVSFEDDIGLPLQESVQFNSVKDMFRGANDAYATYKDTGVVNYGYLIRIGSRQYLIESSLMKSIRHIFYSNKFNKLDTAFDKKKYITVNAFLDAGKHDMFKVLFPQYTKEFKTFEKKVDELVDAITNIIVENRNEKTYKAESIVDIVAMELYHCINKSITIKIHKKEDVANLLYTFVYSTKYTNLIYKLVYSM